MRLPIFASRLSLCLALGAAWGLREASAQDASPPTAPAAEKPTTPAPASPTGGDAPSTPAGAPAQPATPAPPSAGTPTPAAPATAAPANTPGAAPATPVAPPAAPVPAPHSALFRFYDKNGDQVLAADEAEKLPQPVREWLAKQKVDVAAGLTKEAFETHAPKLMDHLRARTAETVLAPVPLPTSAPQAAPSTGRPSRGGNPGSSEFRALDLDQDAQLSFREWRAGKRLAAEFAPRDMNGDGVVTATEFDQTKALASTAPPSSTRPATPGAPTTPATAPGAAPPRTGGTPGSTPPAVLATTPSTPAAGSGLGTTASRQTFETLDKNKDGMVNPDEWGGSRVVGPKFKMNGIDITKNMTREDFHANYVKAFQK